MVDVVRMCQQQCCFPEPDRYHGVKGNPSFTPESECAANEPWHINNMHLRNYQLYFFLK